MEAFIDSTVYIRCPRRSWIIGKLEDYVAGVGGTCRAVNDGGDVLTKVPADDIHPLRDGEVEDVDDLLMLTELHDATLLHCVKKRYFSDVIYTNIGAIVVALNPFNFKIPRYLDSVMPQYLSEGEIIEKNLPHSWACAHNTYYEMRNDRFNQCILVSGESGAGKTEASKIVMKYLAAVSSLTGEEKERQAASEVGHKINMSSPALEAFGNAKTVRNDNSSRFGKFMKVKFDPAGFLVGAHITKYLLEKSRIVSAAQGERVYHSFYLLLRSKNKAKYLLEDDKKYRSVCSGGTLNNKEFDTDAEFQEVCLSMTLMGLSAEEIDGIWGAVAGILHFENVDFIPDGEGSMISASSAEHIERGTKMWGVDKEEYERELRETTLVIMGAPVKKLMTPSQALDARSAVNKAVYESCFSFIVNKCNEKLDKEDCGTGNWIGLLDIFGFEDFKHNSFEQLCINLTNETLQNHYNTFIFCKDVEECRAEGIDVSSIAFDDNTDCLKMISAPGGIMPLLDEECQLGSGTDTAFFNKVLAKFTGHKFFAPQKMSRTNFVIHHYAGSVSYDTTDWREKNLDTVKDAWKTLLRASSNRVIRQLLPAPVETKGPKVTVSLFFRRQLNELMEVINSTNPHWIRCIKPHPAKKPLHFDGVSVMSQLSSSGVLGTVKVRKAGFAVRIPLATFEAQFKIIAKSKGVSPTASNILQACGYKKSEAQVGKRRVFLRSHIYLDIETRKKAALSGSASIVQGFAKGYVGYLQTTQQVHQAHRSLIDKLTKCARELYRAQVTEAQKRRKLMAEQQRDVDALRIREEASRQSALDAEYARRQEVINQILSVHAKQQENIVMDEEAFRDGLLREEEIERAFFHPRIHESFQNAMDLQARREHNEAEKILMQERRHIREARRERELAHILEASAKRLDPTLNREDRTMRALQLQSKAKGQQLEMLKERALEEEQRKRAVEERHERRRKKEAERIQEKQVVRHRNIAQMARAHIAHERYERVMHEDFEWQKLERQMLMGQQLALEEQRRVFLREKAELDRKRRDLMKLEEEQMREQKAKEIFERRARLEEDEKRKKAETARQERQIFQLLAEHREEQRMRERTRRVEHSIAWDNDRRERISLQRPDIPRAALDELPLSERVGAPEPFMMVGNVPTFAKIWTPFRVVKLDAAPRCGVVLGGQFTISWLATRCPPRSRLVVYSGSGLHAKRVVNRAVGEAQFTAPTEWFSELEIVFEVDGREQQAVTIPKAAA